jgi:LPXTG-motif cell wall-anchored protein
MTNPTNIKAKGMLAAGAFLGSLLVLGSPVSAQTCDYPETDCAAEVEVKAIELEPTAPATPAVVPVAASPAAPAAAPAVAAKQQLPVTGGDAGLVAGVGALMVAGGVVLVRRSRALPAD